MKKTTSITSAAALVMLVVFFSSLIILSPAARAASYPGRIYGRLLDGTHKNAPVAKQKVTLQLTDGSAAIDLDIATTGADGTYSFSNLQTDKSFSYSVYTSYEGAQYNTSLTNLATKPVQQINLAVYEATSSTKDIAIVQGTILLHAPDAQKDTIVVSELLIFRNLTNRTYVGSLAGSQGMPNALRFSLPHTATNLVLGAGFNGYQGAQIPGGFAANAAVPPGDSQFSFTFDIPYSVSSYDFDFQVNYPIVRLSILLPASVHASSDTLKAQGPQQVGQQTLDLFTGAALLPGKSLHLQLDGLPVSNQFPGSTPSAASSSPDWTYLYVALAIMAVIMLLTLLIFRSMRAKSTGGSIRRKRAKNVGAQFIAPKSGTMPISENDESNRPPQTGSEEALLRQMLKLDKAYEAGKINKADYEQRRAKLKARLRAIMSEKVTS